MSTKLRVGLTRDILDSRGEPAFGRAALEILDCDPNLQWEYLPAVVSEIGPEIAAQYDALYVNIARVPAAAVERANCRLRVVARHGVGYDSVDVPAMTRAGVLVTNTPTSMPRPVATLAECRINDPTCDVSLPLARKLVANLAKTQPSP